MGHSAQFKPRAALLPPRSAVIQLRSNMTSTTKRLPI